MAHVNNIFAENQQFNITFVVTNFDNSVTLTFTNNLSKGISLIVALLLGVV